jgi:hypothetical protein
MTSSNISPVVARCMATHNLHTSRYIATQVFAYDTQQWHNVHTKTSYSSRDTTRVRNQNDRNGCRHSAEIVIDRGLFDVSQLLYISTKGPRPVRRYSFKNVTTIESREAKLTLALECIVSGLKVIGSTIQVS